MRPKFTEEEEIIINILGLFTHNTFSEFLLFDNFHYDEKNLINIINLCKIGGLVFNLIRNKQLRNVPKKLIDELEKLKYEYLQQEESAMKIINNVLQKLRRENVRCLVAGSYLLQTQFLSKGDILIDEITLFVEKKLDLQNFETNRVKIIQIEKPKEFFDKYYNACLKINIADINTSFIERAELVNEQGQLDDKIIQAYLLYQFYIEQSRYIVTENQTEKYNRIINATFAINPL